MYLYRVFSVHYTGYTLVSRNYESLSSYSTIYKFYIIVLAFFIEACIYRYNVSIDNCIKIHLVTCKTPCIHINAFKI